MSIYLIIGIAIPVVGLLAVVGLAAYQEYRKYRYFKAIARYFAKGQLKLAEEMDPHDH